MRKKDKGPIMCSSCAKREAIKHEWGYLPCAYCTRRLRRELKPIKNVEFTSASIKAERAEYAKSIIQPFRNGELSKEYVELYGTKGIKATPDEAANAKYVWNDEVYYKRSD